MREKEELSVVRPELLQIAEAVARDKSIEQHIVIEAMEQAIQSVAKKKYGQDLEVKATIDEKTGEKEYRSEVYSKKVNRIMMPGDVTYIPRDTYHIITPLQSRLTYSFGICDPNNVSG